MKWCSCNTSTKKKRNPDGTDEKTIAEKSARGEKAGPKTVWAGGAGKSNAGRIEPQRCVYLPPPGGYAALPFSIGVFAGGTFYVAGHIGLEPGTRNVPADPDQEARLLLDGVRATLAKAGLTMDDLVSVQIFCSDVSLFDRFNVIYRTYFTGPLPGRAFLGSGPLLFGARFEICAVAVKRNLGR